MLKCSFGLNVLVSFSFFLPACGKKFFHSIVSNDIKYCHHMWVTLAILLITKSPKGRSEQHWHFQLNCLLVILKLRFIWSKLMLQLAVLSTTTTTATFEKYSFFFVFSRRTMFSCYNQLIVVFIRLDVFVRCVVGVLVFWIAVHKNAFLRFVIFYARL